MLVKREAGALDEVFISKGDKFARKCFYMFMELDMRDFFGSKNTGKSMAFPEEHTATQKECLKMRHLSVVEDFCAFLQNYVEENAIILPGRIPRFQSDEIRVLSSSESKMSVRWI